MQDQFDVVLIGGGIAGISLALVLASAGFRVAIVEAKPTVVIKPILPNDKTLVLAHSSRCILESIGVWQQLVDDVTHIKEVHVSDQGHFGSSRIFAEHENLPALGYVVSAVALNNLLYEQALKSPVITFIQPAHFNSFEQIANNVHVTITKNNNNEILVGKLLVGCDGHTSAVRQFLKIPCVEHNYEQTALVCTVELKRAHLNCAYERFTEQGPLAMLPLENQQCAVIWTVANRQVAELLALSENNFNRELQRVFGYRLGKFTRCSKPLAIELKQLITTQQVVPGAVLLGNAVHTLHPVAGQGLNLALRDLAVLAEELIKARQINTNLGDVKILHQYLKRREADQRAIIDLTHNLVGLFSNNLLPLVLARNAGMMLLDRVSAIKKILTRRALGFSGKVPRLACNLGLE